MKSIMLLTLALHLAPVAFAQSSSLMSSSEGSSVLGSLMSPKPRYSREMVLGNILKGALENMHLSNKEIGDSLSQDAFKLFIERLDYGKQFLLLSDVAELEKYKKSFDDMMISGDLAVLEASSQIFNKRIGEIEKHVEAILKAPLNYKQKKRLKQILKKENFSRRKKNFLLIGKNS